MFIEAYNYIYIYQVISMIDKVEIKAAIDRFDSMSKNIGLLRQNILSAIQENFTDAVSRYFVLQPGQDTYNVQDAPTTAIANLQSLLNLLVHFENLLLALKDRNNIMSIVNVPENLYKLIYEFYQNNKNYSESIKALKNLNFGTNDLDLAKKFSEIIDVFESYFPFAKSSPPSSGEPSVSVLNPADQQTSLTASTSPSSQSSSLTQTAISMGKGLEALSDEGMASIKATPEIGSLKKILNSFLDTIDAKLAVRNKKKAMIKPEEKIRTHNLESLRSIVDKLKKYLDKNFNDKDIANFSSISLGDIPSIIRLVIDLKDEFNKLKINEELKNYFNETNQLFRNSILELNEYLKEFSDNVDSLEETLGLKKGIIFDKLKLNEFMDNVEEVARTLSILQEPSGRFLEERMKSREERIIKTEKEINELNIEIDRLKRVDAEANNYSYVNLNHVKDLDSLLKIARLHKIINFELETGVESKKGDASDEIASQNEFNQHLDRILSTTNDIQELNQALDKHKEFLTEEQKTKINQRREALEKAGKEDKAAQITKIDPTQEKVAAKGLGAWFLQVASTTYNSVSNGLYLIASKSHYAMMMDKDRIALLAKLDKLKKTHNSLQHKLEIMKSHQSYTKDEKHTVDIRNAERAEAEAKRAKAKDLEKTQTSVEKDINPIYRFFNDIKNFLSDISLFGKSRSKKPAGEKHSEDPSSSKQNIQGVVTKEPDHFSSSKIIEILEPTSQTRIPDSAQPSKLSSASKEEMKKQEQQPLKEEAVKQDKQQPLKEEVVKQDEQQPQEEDSFKM